MVTELCYLGTSPCLLFKNRKKKSFSYSEKYKIYLIKSYFKMKTTHLINRDTK